MVDNGGPASGLSRTGAVPQQQQPKPPEASNTKKRKVSEDATNATTARNDLSAPPPPIHTRTMAACDACRVSKTRCDAARPVCAKCLKRGRNCVYPDRDPTSMFETWGKKILSALENQSQLLSEVAQSTAHNIHLQQHHQHHHQQQSPQSSHHPPALDDDDPENMSRKDVPWTPITGSDKILNWIVFPRERPAQTLPPSAFVAKPNHWALETASPSVARIYELRDIFFSQVEPKCPLVDVEDLDAYIAEVIEHGFAWTSSSCLVLIVFALAAIWGHYPDDERRLVVSNSAAERYTAAVPEHRIRESSIYLGMAQRRLSAASQDESLVGALCYLLYGNWLQYNFEPIQAWKMFRTASTLWETYNLKCAHGRVQKPKREASLEARCYWTCLKSEYEMRYEIPDLPPCSLQESPSIPFSSSPFSEGVPNGSDHLLHNDSPGSGYSVNFTPSSHYYFLAEISLRRLLNRARHAATMLSPNIDSITAARVADIMHQLEGQLQKWLECLPPALRFNVPPDSWPAPDEPELVKLMRERYVEVRELLYRVFLYICLHGGTRLTHAQAKMYGAKASAGLRLSIYRINTERPFYRHAGSWIACRVRFNQALCLLAAVRGLEMAIESAAYVAVPPTWRECVCMVRDRLETWSDQGGGVGELALLLGWLLK
ncbi:uncharacterized protein F5Z01DRAFT_629750 [Emericellopsis atlantica]|uniref:Zn(2)-C6 fungal-type domain-containing protein n=1 Tax=Emericellopsis atlantica TaxID=2614577 RepID=A0A9P7ZDX7_9HYPO|nr:uncharacterized protein F5Z01DRAFT_629750 [Emericellopsis atlantica]KAG9250354.1 hypothetical protein F5Z01DRAFT_629750 [Emericellopsis atlantica]